VRKKRVEDKPVAISGTVTFEFFNNDDEDFKIRELVRLAKELRKEINVSAVPFEMNAFENPERGAIAFSLVAANLEQGRAIQNKVLKFLDEHAPARIISEEIETTDLVVG
jgi:hypothetical protein